MSYAILILVVATAVTPTRSASQGRLPVSVNDASRTQLMTVPGVDKEVALRIIEHRPYSSIDQLVVDADLPLETVRVARQRFSLVRILAPPIDSLPRSHGGRTGAGIRPINVNAATAEELMRELEIDRKAAARLMSARPYETVAAFLAIAQLAPPVTRRLTGRLMVAEFSSRPGPDSQRVPPDPRTLNLKNGPAPTPRPPIALADRLDINTVTRDQMLATCGIDAMEAEDIIRARPFRSLRELGSRLGYSKDQIERTGRCLRVGQTTK